MCLLVLPRWNLDDQSLDIRKIGQSSGTPDTTTISLDKDEVLLDNLLERDILAHFVTKLCWLNGGVFA